MRQVLVGRRLRLGSNSSILNPAFSPLGLKLAYAAGAGRPQAQVGVIMGSDSDLGTMQAAVDVLREFKIPCEVTVVSAHRTPERLINYGRSAHHRGIKVCAPAQQRSIVFSAFLDSTIGGC